MSNLACDVQVAAVVGRMVDGARATTVVMVVATAVAGAVAVQDLQLWVVCGL